MNRGRRTQEDRRQETRKKLIDATIKVINEKGYAAMRTGDITKSAGVTWGAAQHLFGGKTDLLNQVASVVSERLIDALETDIDSLLPAEGKLEKIIDQTWALYGSNTYFAMVEIIRGTRKDPAIHDRLAEAQMRITTKVEALWIKIFSPHDILEADVLRLCHIVTLYLAGLAARKIYFMPAAETADYVTYIKDLTSTELRRISK